MIRRDRAGPRLAATIAALAVALGVAAGAGLPPAARAASPRLISAQARATELRQAVDRLQLQAEQATEAYDAAQAELATVVSEHLLATRALEQAQSSADAQSSAADDRMRALYEAGGPAALYATLLDGASIADLEARYQSVSTIVGADRTATTRADRATAAAARIEARLGDLALRQTQLEARSAAEADRVRSLLAQTASLLAGADAQVRRIAEADRLAAVAAAARAAAARLAAARLAVAQSRLLAEQAGKSPALAAALGNPGAPSPVAERAIATAVSRLGRPYVWGGSGPDVFDCSGLTSWSYARAGLRLPRTAAEQWYAGAPVGLGQLAPGDLLFWATDTADPATIHHVAMYLGNGMMVVAPHTGDVVSISPIYLDGYFGAVRPTVGATVAAAAAAG